MTLKISIASTSFVLPRNSAWKAVADHGDLTFADFGDYGIFMRAPADETLIFVAFAQDLMKDRYADFDSALLDPLIDLIAQRAARATAPTIVAISSWEPRSVVTSARAGDPGAAAAARLQAELTSLRETHTSLYVIDLDSQLGVDGFARAFDSRNWYFAHCRLSQHGILTVAQSVAAVLERLARPRKKVLVLDCDNTLWGGVIGEDGLDGITLGSDGVGSAFTDFQRAAKRLCREGVLLALSSKNNEAEVWEVFERHASMILTKDDVVTSRINWSEKSQGLREMAEELDLALDSFVFWDDNPFERSQVKTALPMVDVVDVPPDVTAWADRLHTLASLQSLTSTQEDRNKTRQYKARAEFSRNLGQASDKSDFLASIKMVPVLHPVAESTVVRAHQLVSKTNQFNLRSIRYTKEQVAALAADDRNICHLVSVSDIYGDHGIVALVICRRVEQRVAFLDTLLMSCRVLGRRLESWVLKSLVERLRELGVLYLVGEYIPTPRNGVCATVLEDHGFARLTADEIVRLGLGEVELVRGLQGVRYIVDVREPAVAAPH